jgi:hypothetical protein
MSSMQNSSYEHAWKEYSRRTCANEFGLSLVAIFITVISLKPMVSALAALLPVCCLLVLVRTVRSERMLRCPRCDAPWNGNAVAVAPSRSDCERCDLAKWEGFSRSSLIKHRRLIGSTRLASALVLGASGIVNVVSNQPLGWPVVVLATGYFTLAVFGPDGWWQHKEALARASTT